jgi:hypothetical protein
METAVEEAQGQKCRSDDITRTVNGSCRRGTTDLEMVLSLQLHYSLERLLMWGLLEILYTLPDRK